MPEWFSQFHTYLEYSNPAMAQSDSEKESLPDAIKAAVCQNIQLFMEMNEDEFKQFLQTFVSDVWKLLITVTDKPGQVSC